MSGRSGEREGDLIGAMEKSPDMGFHTESAEQPKRFGWWRRFTGMDRPKQ